MIETKNVEVFGVSEESISLLKKIMSERVASVIQGLLNLVRYCRMGRIRS